MRIGEKYIQYSGEEGTEWKVDSKYKGSRKDRKNTIENGG